MLSPAERFLMIPEDYARSLGGLRWSSDGSVIETAAGNVFAWRREIHLFLEGFISVRPPLHFAHILHLMKLLGIGPISATDAAAAEMKRSFLLTDRPLRNAGVFCALLCRDFPGSCLDISPARLRHELTQDKPPVAWADPEAPALGAAEFLPKVFESLRRYSAEEMVHWFKFGCAPSGEAAERIADALNQRPPNLTDVLAKAAANRERLRGALALAPSLAGALTLPPRRLDVSDLPLGGYADVTTRGQPEHLLPSQHAVDGLEFVRRFAEKELLYFRREEPFDPTREELVILLDQGVRTWGGVRLALAGAVFALAGIAKRRKLAVRLATTANDGQTFDPSNVEPPTLGDLLEASDLTPHPGTALENVVQEDSERLRDVVILTHPRSLIQHEVAQSARLRRDSDRLFAVTVDSAGEGRLCDLRGGQPVPLTRFRLDLAGALNPPRANRAFGPAPDAWTGDVEPIPFPFWFGPMGDIQQVAIDQESRRFLVACANGMLHAQKLDGSSREVLPRGVSHGQVLKSIEDVLGVHHGFVVCGSIPNPAKGASFQFQGGLSQPFRPDPAADSIPIVVHYDFRTRRAVSRVMMPSRTPPARWVYFPNLNSIAYFDGSGGKALDLETGGTYPSDGNDLSLTLRARAALSQAGTHPFRILPEKTLAGQAAWRNFDRHSGTLDIWGISAFADPIVPRSDGEAVLRNASIVDVQYSGDTLAIHAMPEERRDRRVFLIRGPDARIVRELVPHEHYPPMHLSADGRLIALKTNHHEVSVFATDSGSEAVAIMEAGGCHSNVEITTGPRWLLVSFGKCQHLFDWNEHALRHVYARAEAESFLQEALSGQAMKRKRHVARSNRVMASDPTRFKSFPGYETAGATPMKPVLDQFGHVALLSEAGDRLLAVIGVRRNKSAIWLPDGTRWGDPELAGPPTPGASERIARALKEAEPS